MKHVRFRLDGTPCTIQVLRHPMNGYKHEDYIFILKGRRYDLSKWFGHNGNFKYK